MNKDRMSNTYYSLTKVQMVIVSNFFFGFFISFAEKDIKERFEILSVAVDQKHNNTSLKHY